MKNTFVCLIWFSFMCNAIALAQTNLSRALPTNHTMPPMEFSTRPFDLARADGIIDEPAGASLMQWTLFDLPRLSLVDFGSIARKAPLHQKPQSPEEQFSLDNLFDGLIYDFRKKDDMRLEFGGPGLGEWNLSEADIKYDVPFCLLILLNRKF